MRNWLTCVFPHVFPARFPALYAVLLVLGLNSDSLLALISFALIGLCDDFGRSFTIFIESKSAPMYNHVNVFLPTVINLHTNRCVRTIGKVRWHIVLSGWLLQQTVTIQTGKKEERHSRWSVKWNIHWWFTNWLNRKFCNLLTAACFRFT